MKKIQEVKEVNKAVIFCRVSTKEQEDGHSLDAQLGSNIEYCDKNNLTVIEKFRIIESASKIKRPEFDKMLEFITKQKGKIALVCYAVDRLQRDLKSLAALEELVRSGKIEIHSIRENTVLDENSDDFVYMINALMARRETKVLGKRVKFVFAKKLEDGTILGPAPIGYLNKKRIAAKKEKREPAEVYIDEERAPFIKTMFGEYAKGKYSMNDLRIEITKLGLRTKQDKKR